jgi:hypothetical protein
MFISKGIVEQHGGSLTVTSPGIDQGTSVAVELPIYGEFSSTAGGLSLGHTGTNVGLIDNLVYILWV